MAFIDEIGNKIATAGKKTTKAISDMSQMSKIKESINAEQSKIYQWYAAIGEAYFERYESDTTEEPFSSICIQIHGSKDFIEKCEEEIRIVQNMKLCPECGTSCTYNSAFCSICGYAFPKTVVAQDAEARFCSNCGTALMDSSVFCSECGQPLTGLRNEETEMVAQVSPETEEVIVLENPDAYEEKAPDIDDIKEKPEPDPKVCSNCGEAITDDALFCAECGTSVK